MKRLPEDSPRELSVSSLSALLRLARDPLGAPVAYHRTHGDVVALRIFGMRLLLAQDPEFLDEVLVRSHRKFKKDVWTRGLSRLLGDGLLTSEGARWRAHRKLMQPAFQPSAVERSIERINGLVRQHIAEWKPGETRDIAAEMGTLTLRIALDLLFGEADLDIAGVGRSMHAVMTFFVGVMGSGYPLPSFVPTRTGRDFRKATAHLDGLFHEIIRRARARASRGQARPACLLDALIAARNEDGAALTEVELRDECVTLLLAGHETTALTLTYALFLVGTRPELSEALRAEAAGLPEDGPLSPADVRKLDLAARVVKEAMRLYPPAWMIGREAVEDCRIAGYDLRKGTQVLISQWAVHRNEKYFREPEHFLPERWTPEFEASLPRWAYLPFGGGPRVCIGNHLALLESVIALSEIHRRVRLEFVPDRLPPLLASITVRPNGPVPARIARHPSTG